MNGTIDFIMSAEICSHIRSIVNSSDKFNPFAGKKYCESEKRTASAIDLIFCAHVLSHIHIPATALPFISDAEPSKPRTWQPRAGNTLRWQTHRFANQETLPRIEIHGPTVRPFPSECSLFSE